MFDMDKVERMRADKAPAAAPWKWDSMNVNDLIAYRDEITAALRKQMPLSLKDISIEQELLLQFETLRALQTSVLDDIEVPPNQKAQVANTVGTVLARLAELQNTIYESERFKKIEGAVIRFMLTLDADAQVRALAEYERAVLQADE